MNEDTADIAVERILTYLSKVRLVGDALEAITPEEYDAVEDALSSIVLTTSQSPGAQ